MGKIWYVKVYEKEYKSKRKVSRIFINDGAKTKIRRGVNI